MTRSLMITLLSKGNTGNEILEILEALSTDQCDTQPTVDSNIEPLTFAGF